jgi:hypothetical protein
VEWNAWILSESEEEFLLLNSNVDATDDVMVIHYTEDGLSYTSEDLVRRGPSGRLCIEDDERLLDGLPSSTNNIRIREDLFEDMPPLLDIVVNEEEDEVQIIEPEIVYLKTVINIDLS